MHNHRLLPHSFLVILSIAMVTTFALYLAHAATSQAQASAAVHATGSLPHGSGRQIGMAGDANLRQDEPRNNLPPIARSDSYTGTEDITFNSEPASVLDNDSDPDGDNLRPLLTGAAQHGSIILSGDGTFGYVPQPDFFGSDVFTYTLRDEGGLTALGTVRIFITPVNDPPTLDVVPNLTIEDAAARTIPLSGISPGKGGETDPLTISVASSNRQLFASPTISYNDPAPTGTLTITPTAQMSGTAELSLRVSDGIATTTRRFRVNVTNTAPFFTSEPDTSARTRSLYTYTVSSSDLESSSGLQIMSTITLPEWLTLRSNGDGTAVLRGIPEEAGTYPVGLRVLDPLGASSPTQTFTITVEPYRVLIPLVMLPTIEELYPELPTTAR